MGGDMAKFKIKLKLQGLELEIEGSREEVPNITQNLGRQIAGMLQPAGAIVVGEVVGGREDDFLEENLTQVPRRQRTRRKRVQAQTTRESPVKEDAVDWKHDPSKYGSPKQGWSTADKSLWLLSVVSQEAGINELSGQRIVLTFNKHFRQAGPIRTQNANRDLGRLKVNKTPSPVAEDTTKTPSQWFLTEEGVKSAQSLMADALGRTA
jgi:hypothetical protein